MEICIMLLKTVIQNTLPITPRTSKPQKQNPFEFNPCPQNTNQIKHLEQTKEINNKKKKAKMLGPGARKDKEN